MSAEPRMTIAFRAHQFGGFDHFRCPRQQRLAMQKSEGGSAATLSQSQRRPDDGDDLADAMATLSVSAQTLQRGIDFERLVVDRFVRPFVDNDHIYDGAAAATSVLRSDFPNAAFIDMLNDMAAKARAKFADPQNRGRSARFVIDQLELFPPDNLHELVQASQDLPVPVTFGRMKPDIVRVRVTPVEPNDLGVDVDFRITIADIKSSASMKRSHRMQVALYSMVIENEVARARNLRLLDRSAVFHHDTKGEVWLPSSFQRFLDLTRRRESVSSPVRPLRECDDICVENFGIEEAKHDVVEYFRRFMPLVQRADIEDIPWLLQHRRCTGCAYRESCSRRALEMRHAGMCMGTAELPVAQFVEGDANDSDADDSDLARETIRPLVDILADVPLETPTVSGRRGTSPVAMTLSEAQSAADKQGLQVLGFAIRKKIEAIDTRRPITLDFVTEFNGFVPHLPGIIMVDAASPEGLQPSMVASVVLTTEPGISSAFRRGSVAFSEAPPIVTENIAEFCHLLGRARFVAVWDDFQLARLRDVLFHSDSGLFVKFFPSVDSALLQNWRLSSSLQGSADEVLSASHELFPVPQTTFVVQNMIRDTIALPIAGTAPSFNEAEAWLLPKRDDGVAEVHQSVEDALLASGPNPQVALALRSLFEKVANETISQRRFITRAASSSAGESASDEVARDVASDEDPNSNEWRAMIRTFHVASTVTDCKRAQTRRVNLCGGDGPHRLVYAPDSSVPSLCRFEVVANPTPGDEWRFLAARKAAVDSLHAAFASEALTTPEQMRQSVAILSSAEKPVEFVYCDGTPEGKQQIRKQFGDDDSVQYMAAGRWYWRRPSSRAPKWKRMEELGDELTGPVDFKPCNLALCEEAVNPRRLDGLDDAALLVEGMGMWRTDKALKDGLGFGFVMACELVDGRLFVYINFSVYLSIKGGIGATLLCAVRTVNMNYAKVASAIARLSPATDPIFQHTISGSASANRRPLLRPLKLAPESTLPPNVATVLSYDQRRFFDSVQVNPLTVLWGPPGTGKTFTLACLLAMLTDASACPSGVPISTLVVAFTRKAIEELRRRFERLGFESCYDEKKRTHIATRGANVIIFSTVWQATKSYSEGAGAATAVSRKFDILVIDEASQMSVQDALVAGGCVDLAARVILAGDALQLSPIVSPAAQESRIARDTPALRPVLVGSVLEAVLFRGDDPSKRLTRVDMRSCHNRGAVAAFPDYLVQLTTTYRSTVPELVGFVGHIYPRYNLSANAAAARGDGAVLSVVQALELHLLSPEGSTTELSCAKPIIENVLAQQRFSLGIVTPHRRQREAFKALVCSIQSASPALAVAEVFVDTAERMQGREFDVVLVALATVKPSFTYNVNRLNVAFSRARMAIIVISTPTVISPPKELLASVVAQQCRTFGGEADALVEVSAAVDYLRVFSSKAMRVTVYNRN